MKAYPKVRPGRHGRAGPAAEGIPERTCMGCRQRRPKRQLLRCVLNPLGQLMLDAHGKLPSRGAYCCARQSCVEHAVAAPRLEETFGPEATCGPVDELVHAMARVLEARAVACVRMARKAGRAVSGYTQVRRALSAAPIACLLVAEDTAAQRRDEYQGWCAQRQIPCRSFLNKARLGELVGRHASSAIGILDLHLGRHLLECLEGMSRLTER